MSQSQQTNIISEYWDKEHAKSLLESEGRCSMYAKKVSQNFPANSSVVDIGGGLGYDAEFFLEKGHQVILVDSSPVALRQAEERIKKLYPNHGRDFKTLCTVLGEESIPLPDSSTDIVYSRFALHFFNRKQTVEIFKEILRVLKVGGSAYISIKSPDDTQGQVKEIDFLRRNAKEIELSVFIDQEGVLLGRFGRSQWLEILKEVGISNYQVNFYTEEVYGGGEDGSTEVLATEIVLFK